MSKDLMVCLQPTYFCRTILCKNKLAKICPKKPQHFATLSNTINSRQSMPYNVSLPATVVLKSRPIMDLKRKAASEARQQIKRVHKFHTTGMKLARESPHTQDADTSADSVYEGLQSDSDSVSSY